MNTVITYFYLTLLVLPFNLNVILAILFLFKLKRLENDNIKKLILCIPGYSLFFLPYFFKDLMLYAINGIETRNIEIMRFLVEINFLIFFSSFALYQGIKKIK